MTMYGALQRKSDVDRLYIKKKEGGRVLISVESCVREEENSLGFYVANSEENLIKGVAAAETINTEDTVTSGEFKKQKAQELKQNCHEKKMYGQFIREMPKKVDKDKSWQWLSKSDLKIRTEAMLCAAQEQTVRTSYVKHHIDRPVKAPCANYVEKKVKVCSTQSVDVKNSIRENIRNDTIMQQRKCIGTFVKRMGQKTGKHGINTSQKEQQKMKK